MQASIKWSLAALLSTEFLVWSNIGMVQSSLPIHLLNEGFSEDRMGILFGVFMLSALLFRPLFAHIGKKNGQQCVLFIAVLIALAAPWFYYMASGFAAFMVARIFHGLVPASMMTAVSLLLIEACGEDRKSLAIGAFGIVYSLSKMVMPYVGVHLMLEYSVLVWLAVSSAYGMAAVLLFLAFIRPRVSDTNRWPETGARLPVSSIAAPLVVSVFFGIGAGAMLAFVSPYAVSIGFENPGVFFTMWALFMLVSQSFVSLFGDSIPQRSAVILGLLLSVAGVLLLIAPPAPIWVIISGIPAGLGGGMIISMMTIYVTNCVSKEFRSTGVAYVTNSWEAGMVCGTMLLGGIITRWSYEALFMVILITNVLSLLVAVAALREPSGEAKPETLETA